MSNLLTSALLIARLPGRYDGAVSPLPADVLTSCLLKAYSY